MAASMTLCAISGKPQDKPECMSEKKIVEPEYMDAIGET